MKRLKIFTTLLFSIFMITGNVWAGIVSLPTVQFSGTAETVTTIGDSAGYLELNSIVSQINYDDGTYCSTACGIDESIIGMQVRITGAARTGDYTFTDGQLSISDGTFNYLTATLVDISFVPYNALSLLNSALSADNPSSLNLRNVVLNTDVDHPSKFINELSAKLGGLNIIGMKMFLTGDVTGDNVLNVYSGLIDGVNSGLKAPITVRSIGYWKNHVDERDFFICFADINVDIFSTTDDLIAALDKKGKKTMEEKIKQQLAALLLNVAAGLDPATKLTAGELEILTLINPVYNETATVSDAIIEIENALFINELLEDAKDLTDEINNRDH